VQGLGLRPLKEESATFEREQILKPGAQAPDYFENAPDANTRKENAEVRVQNDE
jgi:hypothetical protein